MKAKLLITTLAVASLPIMGYAGSLSLDKTTATQQAKVAYESGNYGLAFKLAQQGDMDDGRNLYYLADMYYNGRGCSVDRQLGLELMQKSAEKGDPFANAWIGHFIDIPKGDYKSAEGHLRIAVDQKNSLGYFALGRMYEKGQINGTPDKGEALRYYRKAVTESDNPMPWILTAVGERLADNGENSSALALFRRAAEKKFPSALFILGRAYKYEWYGLVKNFGEAERYLKEAIACAEQLTAESTELSAIMELIGLYGERMSSGDCSDSIRGAIYKYHERLSSLDAKHEGDKETLGRAYLSLGLIYCAYLEDYKRGFEAYTAAANLDNGDAWADLGIMYENGEYVAKSEEEARKCYERGASLKSACCMWNLAGIYDKEGDKNKALAFLVEAHYLDKDDVLILGTLLKVLQREGRIQEFKHIVSRIDVEATVRKAIESDVDWLKFNFATYLDNGLFPLDKGKSSAMMAELSKKSDCCASAHMAHEAILKGDNKKAFDLLTMAYKENPNCPNVLKLLGVGCLNRRWQTPRDGIAYLAKAATQKSQSACITLACCYAFPPKELNLGIVKDYKKARLYAEMAAQEEELKPYADVLIAWIDIGESDMMPQSEKCKKAFNVIKKNADDGRVMAFGLLAACYQNGWGTSKNRAKADEWYEKARNYQGPSFMMEGYKRSLEKIDAGKKKFDNSENGSDVETSNKSGDKGKSVEASVGYPHEWPMPLGMFRGVFEICVSPIDAFRGLVTKPFTHLFGAVDLIERVGAGVADICTFGWVGNKLYGISRDFEIWPWGCNCDGCKVYWREKNIGGR
ncbi:MAG: sel1 repeat family protein [Kiritimatiellae bacterium]|nr:sel1 repeat family protein [Kiritimatiellia bacterium]